LLVSGKLDSYRGVVEALADQYDVLDVAAAAVKLADEASDGGEREAEEEIPNAVPPRRDERPSRTTRSRNEGAREVREERPSRGERPRGERPRGDRGKARRRDGADVTRLYVALGRKAGVRPADLVGAIANEAGIDSRDIGAIEITDRFSLVEVPDDAADDIIRALSGTTIRGKRVAARRDRAGA